MPDYYVYLKTGKHDTDDGSSLNTIPLRVNSVNISTTKTIPSFPVPLSGLASGESLTAALDLGMATKQISLSGFIVQTTIKRTDHTGTENTVDMTAHDIAQLIHSSVDSTALAPSQAIKELIILYPSKVNNSYGYWNSDESTKNIPWTFRSRGSPNQFDNEGVPASNTFPTSSDSPGLEGFVRSFSTPLEAETVEISFQMEFEVANMAP